MKNIVYIVLFSILLVSCSTSNPDLFFSRGMSDIGKHILYFLSLSLLVVFFIVSSNTMRIFLLFIYLFVFMIFMTIYSFMDYITSDGGILTFFLLYIITGIYYHIKYYLLYTNEVGNSYDNYNHLNEKYTSLQLLLVLYPISLFIIIYIRYVAKMDEYRKQAYNCKKCNKVMIKQPDPSAYLEKGQMAEKKMFTMDYDVWVCPSCNESLVLRYPDPYLNTRSCPECNYYTYKLITSVTIKEANYVEEGIEEKTHECQNCGKKEVEHEVIPIVKPMNHHHYS